MIHVFKDIFHDYEKSWEMNFEMNANKSTPSSEEVIDTLRQRLDSIKGPAEEEEEHSDTSEGWSEHSRYCDDFEEKRQLGKGGFGRVVLCRHRLDEMEYAVKIIHIKGKREPGESILREVKLLAQLDHRHVVRYFQSWIEHKAASSSDVESVEGEGITFYRPSSSNSSSESSGVGSCRLYIQMENCPWTLHQLLMSYAFDKDLACHIFRQIADGLAYIHGKGIVHGDLTPKNIFIDINYAIKIGDFGLAKLLDSEELDTSSTSHASDPTGIQYYAAPEVLARKKHTNKADMYSLGFILYELWTPFDTKMERHKFLMALRSQGCPPADWANKYPLQDFLLRKLLSAEPEDRPSAGMLLLDEFLPRGEIDDVGLYSAVETKHRDTVISGSRKVFESHGAMHLECKPMHFFSGFTNSDRNTAKVLSQNGDLVELLYELRLPFVKWLAKQEECLFKRYEISTVYRSADQSPLAYLQADFDIVGGDACKAEFEVIKVTIDILAKFFNPDSLHIHLSHGRLLESLFSLAKIKDEHRQKIAEIFSELGCLSPLSLTHYSRWKVLKDELIQELHLDEAVITSLEDIGQKLCGNAVQTLRTLRDILPAGTGRVLDELSNLLDLDHLKQYKHIYVDPLMPPTESYYRDMFFQIFLRDESVPVDNDGILLALGGRYNFLMRQILDRENWSAVGTSLALETIIKHSLRSELAGGKRLCADYSLLSLSEDCTREPLLA